MIASKIRCLCLLLHIWVIPTVASNLLLAKERPNIILVFIDDMGWGDFSCFGNEHAKYFGVGKIEKDQVESLAKRKAKDYQIMEKWLSPNLNE